MYFQQLLQKCLADFEQAASVIVLCARQGAFAKAAAQMAQIRSFFRLMGRDTAYWYRRGRGVPVGEGRVALGTLGDSGGLSA